MLFEQYSNGPYVQFDTFCSAVDEFFSKLESQKLELKGNDYNFTRHFFKH